MSGLTETPDDALMHYGVKGMRWGHRKPEESGGDSSSGSQSNSRGLSDGQKKALKYAAGGALVAGAVITTAILAKNGKLPVGNLRPQPNAKDLWPTNGQLNAKEAKAAQAARRQIVRNQQAALDKARQHEAKTRLLDAVAVKNNEAQARQKQAAENLAAEVARRAQVRQAETAERGKRIAERLGMSPEEYWKQQVKNFNDPNYVYEL